MIPKYKKFPLFGTIIVAFAILVSSCQSNPEQGFEIEDALTQTAVESETEPTSTPEEISQAQPVEEQIVEETNECLVCHTSKQTLIDTADSVEVVELESSGEG